MANSQFPQNVGLFVPTTDVWDQASISQIDIKSEEFKLLLVRLVQNLSNIANVLNLKESALYDTQVFLTGQLFFSNTPGQPQKLRNAFRLVMNVGALAAGVNTFAHGLTITTTYTFTRIYATASDNIGFNYYPIPWSGAAGGYMSIVVDATNVVIDNNSGVSFTSCIVVLEYLIN